MAKFHNLEAVDLSFFDTAPCLFKHSLEVECSPQRVMQALADSNTWVKWAGPMKSADWTSDHVGLNCTRDVVIYGGIVMKETFFCWEENVRASFCVNQANVPGLTRFAEDHRITQLGDNRVRLDVTLAVEPSKSAAWLIRPALLPLKLMLPKMLNTYKKILETT